MASLDDGLGDLAAFCALLATTTEAVDIHVQALRSQGADFDTLEPDLREALRGVTSAAEQLEEAMEEAGSEAVEAVGHVAERAEDLDARADSLRGDCASLDESVGQRLEERADALGAAFDELHATAFPRVEAAFNQEQSDLPQWQADAEEHVEAVADALASVTAEAGRARETTVAELDATTAAVEPHEDTLTNTSHEGTFVVSRLDLQLDDEVQARCEEHREKLAGIMTEWAERLESEGDLLQAATADLAEEAAGFLSDERDRLAERWGPAGRELGLASMEAEQLAADLAQSQPGLEEVADLAPGVASAEETIHRIKFLLDHLEPQ
jgi:chromosome segregation ATPase